MQAITNTVYTKRRSAGITAWLAALTLGATAALAAPVVFADDHAVQAKVETDDATPGDGVVNPDDFTASAVRTCDPFYVEYSGSVAHYAEGYCRRRNGSWTWSSWSGSCSGDLANCDGQLRCGRC